MRSTVRPRGSSDRAVLWLACLLAVCAGWYIAFFRLGAAIDDQHDLSAQVGSIVLANRAVVAARPQIERTEHDVDRTIRAFDLHDDHAGTVARFIRECARIAAQHHSNLTQIDERRSGAADARGMQHDADAANFELIPLDVTLTGSYRALVNTIRALAQAPVAIHLEIAAVDRVANGDNAAAAGPLVARLHIGVERLDDDATAAVLAVPSLPTEALHAGSL